MVTRLMSESSGHEMTVTVHKANLITLNGRQHRMAVARATKVLRHAGAINARSQGIPAMKRAHVVVWVSWPDRRRRDAHNIYPTIKALVDGIVSDARVLPDDSDDYLIGPDLRRSADTSGIPGVTALRFVFQEIE